MAGRKKMRLNKVLRELNISLDRAVEYLESQGHEIEARPTTKVSNDLYQILVDEFQTDKSKRVASKEASEEQKREKERLRREQEKILEEKERQKKRAEEERKERERQKELEEKESEKEKQSAKEKAEADKKQAAADKKKQEADKKEQESKKAESERQHLPGITKVGKIDLDTVEQKKTGKKEDSAEAKKKKKESKKSTKPAQKKKEKTPIQKKEEKPAKKEEPKKEEPKKEAAKKETTTEEPAKEESESSKVIETEYKVLEGLSFTGKKIDLDKFKKKPKKKETKKKDSKTRKKRRRISVDKPQTGNRKSRRSSTRRKSSKPVKREEPTEEEVQKQIKETLEKLQSKSGRGKGARYRRDRREERRKQLEEETQQQEDQSQVLKVTEFVTASELATMMNVQVTDVISACMSLGLMVTMNQRLDAETLTIVADEFDFEVEFVSEELEESIQEDTVSDPEDMVARAPIVTVMGHVDHGKTSLLDYIRSENVIAGESGGITQHIGAYGVKLKSGKQMTFLDTPGHEAFTAMRARGAQVTDIAIIVIASDDDVMPQTKEAISHAQAAGVPIVFAINKIDLPTSDPEKIKQKLAELNLLVEDWGGKIQSQDISAKKGEGVDDLLEKVLLEAEILELKADPNRMASGTVVEAFLDKGRGYVSTILVESGTLKKTDFVLAGTSSGKIKAMHDERGNEVDEAGPSTPVSILGLDGAPQAGDKFYVMKDEREAKDIASKRSQLQREQDVRTQRHITLDEIGRRIALGEFKELNIILKGDVDGSVEALSDSFQKLSTEEIQVNIIHKAVGAITESDVLLASASNAVIIGFNVRPTGNANEIASREEIDIRTYSIIYAAIDDLRDAMEGMLSPELKEEIVGNVEIRETFKISKIGTIAGCMVTSGKITRNSKIRLIRDGVVIYTGELASLKRFKDDVREVAKGYECGLQVKNYNDIQEDDVIEAFQEVEVKKKLK